MYQHAKLTKAVETDGQEAWRQKVGPELPLAPGWQGNKGSDDSPGLQMTG